MFHASARPAVVGKPQVSILNFELARQLGLDLTALTSESAASLFAGQTLPKGSEPIAQAYAGHQYGHFTILGDGRAILLGEHRTPSGRLVDIQLKGAGQTAFSRRGDGRAALGPMLREYIISEAMSALGIPTTRSLAVVTTGETVFRSSPLQGAILTRIAASHIRVGTFEYIAARQEFENLKRLAYYTITRHYPNLIESPQKYVELLRSVTERQAELIARWQMVGFIHGVMNTDNMAISGETIDYGPCAFMNTYSPRTVFSSIDHAGRYSYGNQPAIGQWNLARFAETLLPLFDDDQEKAVAIAMEILEKYSIRFREHWVNGMRRKLGLQNVEPADEELIQSLLKWMEDTKADFTNTFRALSEPSNSAERSSDETFRNWHQRWQERIQREGLPFSIVSDRMKSVNPAVIPRNHRVEEALNAAELHNDLTVLHRLLDALSRPFETREEFSSYQVPSPDDGCYRTFCGT